MRFGSVFMLVVVMSLLIGASGCPLMNQVGVGTTLSGKVADADGKAIANATVSTIPQTEVVKTDETGYYSISGLQKGTYGLKVSRPGYKTNSQDVKIEDNLLSCASSNKRIDVTLSVEVDESGKPKAKTGSIEGTITDVGSSKGIQGCTVTTEPATKEVGTDSAGKYVIDEVSAGNYTVKGIKSGYLDNVSGTIEVKAGEATVVDLKLTPTNKAGSIKGKVTSGGGTAIEGAMVTTSPATATKTTDASGNYEITNISAGDYVLTATKSGYDTGTKNVTVTEGAQANGDITMTITVYNPNQWIQLSPSGTPPFARYYHSAVWDSVNNRMLIFGGSDNAGTYYNDLWSYNGTSWTQLSPTGTPPSVRGAHTAVWDPVNNRMLVFGGRDVSYYNDLWSYNGTSWTQINPTGTPPSVRRSHVAVWDPVNNRMLIFGGTDGTTSYNDLWSYNGTSWTQINPTGTPPPARYHHSAVWDPVNNRMLVFGGFEPYLNDLWSYDGTSWTQINSTGTPPSGRYLQSAVWDSVNNRMLIFGGYDSSFKNELWSYNGTSWTKLSPTGTPPSPRYLFSAVWDSVNNRMLGFGGFDGSAKGDFWSYK